MRSICIPASPPVDISEFLPIIDHPYFQRLRDIKQLGINDLIFPGARHSRFEHALGVLGLTQRLCRHHAFPEDESRLLQCFALLHDIGHGPYSHQLEPILSGNHHENGVRLIHEMEPAIQACGISPDDVIGLLEGSDSRGLWITDRNLGTDKLDYLRRDALHIGFQGVPDIERIQFYTHWQNGHLSLDERLLEDGKQLQRFYSYLHQHGYLNKTALTAQRMLQRAVHEQLLASGQNDRFLWDSSDYDLNDWLRHAKCPVTRKLADALRARTLHKTFLTLKPTGYGFVEKTADKALVVVEKSRKDLNRLTTQLSRPEILLELENRLSEEYGLKPGDILISAMPYFTKLIPRDLFIFTGYSTPEFSLFSKDFDHVTSLESDYLRTFAIRLAVIPSRREAMARIAQEKNGCLI